MSENINAFTCFNLKPGLTIDWQQLDQIYYAMQQATHPDRFINHAPAIKIVAAQKSAAINAAYRCLKDPIERLWAIIEAHDYAFNRAENIDTHPSIISDVFDLQEIKTSLKTPTAYQDFNNHLHVLIDTAQTEFMALITACAFDQAIVKIYWMTYLHKLAIDTDQSQTV